MKLTEMNDLYSWYERKYPFITNPFLDESKNNQEILVTCNCGAGKRLRVNTVHDTYDLDIKCGNCGRSLREYSSISSHSGGVFNSTSMRIEEV